MRPETRTMAMKPAGLVVNGRYRVHQITGVQRYAHEIVTRLQGEVEVCTPRHSATGPLGHLWEQTMLPIACDGRLLWSPCGIGPLAYSRQLVTFHDLFPLEFPEWYSAPYAKWYSVAMRKLAARAVHLIAVSEYTKSRIVKLLGRDPQQITVIHNGCHTRGRASQDQIHEARCALHLRTDRYVLSLSSLERRKNLAAILQAWSGIHKQLPDDIWLVLAGPEANEAIYAKQESAANLPRVLFTGYVPEEHLAGLYSGASLFVFPSLAEGFGLPLLEAMACGVRCITSRCSSLPEVGGNVVDYVDPRNTYELAHAMLHRLRENHHSSVPFKPVMDRAKHFTWEAAASKTRDVLAAVLGTDATALPSRKNPRVMTLTTSAARLERDEPTGNQVPMRVALVHDWLTGMRGGEKVLEMLCNRFPLAPLWTLLYLRGEVSATIAARPIYTSLLQRMPLAATKYRNYLPFFPLFAELHKSGDADLIISTSHAVAKSMIKRSVSGSNKPYHICYIHTPMRYAWDLFDEYFGPQRVGWFASRCLFRPLVQMLRLYDVKTVNRVDLFLANSKYVAERVRRLYGREAEVLPPPVNTERFRTAIREPEDWYLVVSALVPYKRVDHAIRSCSRMGRRLKIIGNGPELGALKKLAAELNADVEFLGFASDEKLVDYYRRAKSLLFPGVEDFGIVPVESIACGCPVIALGVGGVLDSMTEETAVFYTEPTVEGLMGAILRFETLDQAFPEKTLRERAEFFSEANFLNRFELTLLRVQKQLSVTAHETTIHPPLADRTLRSYKPAA